MYIEYNIRDSGIQYMGNMKQGTRKKDLGFRKQGCRDTGYKYKTLGYRKQDIGYRT